MHFLNRITTDRPPHTNTLTFQKEFLYFRDFKGITLLNFLVTTLFTNHYIISVEVFLSYFLKMVLYTLRKQIVL